MHKILAIIPARGGSKGIPKKSLLELGGKSLIEHAVSGSLKSKYVTRTLFTSDDEEMMCTAKGCGAEVLFRRPDYLASDTATSWSVVKHAVDWLEKNENWIPDFIILLQPTTPFRNEKHIDQSIELMLKNKVTSCISVKEVDYPPQWTFWEGANGSVERLFPEGKSITRRQDARVAWQPNGLIYILTRELLFTDPILPKYDTTLYKMDWEDSINIDNWWQYQISELLYEKRLNNQNVR